jgi:hypothetical protein
MKRDMTGGGSVTATLSALRELGAQVKVTGLICAAENMPSGSAYRPDDVIRHYGGRTTEVKNTDAEGRLVMADAFVAAAEDHPDALVDIATLTGAARVALMHTWASTQTEGWWRQALDIPDGRVENTWENRLKIARVIREQKPRVVILPYWKGRHPDHYTCSTLGYEACFLSGLAKVDTGIAPHRPFKILYATLYFDVRPTFVVDISEQFEARSASTSDP